jgi:hypothetical protein
MRVLFEITNVTTGVRHFALHENCETPRSVMREVETALGELKEDEVKWIVTREMRPGAPLESFFKAHEFAHGGTWLPHNETLWLFKPN